MLERLDHYWRVLGTGFSFFVFGAIGVLLGVTVFPLLLITVRPRQRREEMARSVLRIAFRFHVGLMRFVGVNDYTFSGRERLERRGLLILANHPSLIDAVYLMAYVRNATCVVDEPLARNPFTRGAVRAAGYIVNDLSGLPLVEACIASLAEGGNLVFFPEGHRTSPGGPIVMRRGGAQVAVRGGVDVTPVRIRCEPPTLTRGEKWWQVPPRPAQFTIEVGADITVRPFLEREREPARAARALNAQLQAYFTRGSEGHAGA